MISNNDKIQLALEIVLKKHHKQIRKFSNIPYSIHPISVAMLLLEMEEKEHVIIGGLLHDIIEDTDMTYDEITDLFGLEVYNIVYGCTEHNKLLSWEERKGQTIDNIPNLSRDTQVVVLADKINNLSSIGSHIKEKEVWQNFKRGYASQKWYYYNLKLAFNASKHLKDSKLLALYNALYLDVFNTKRGVYE